jgi:hypothetical protein
MKVLSSVITSLNSNQFTEGHCRHHLILVLSECALIKFRSVCYSWLVSRIVVGITIQVFSKFILRSSRSNNYIFDYSCRKVLCFLSKRIKNTRYSYGIKRFREVFWNSRNLKATKQYTKVPLAYSKLRINCCSEYNDRSGRGGRNVF